MDYKLLYTAKQYKHGWSVWLLRDGKKFMVASSLKNEGEVNKLLSNIELKIEGRYEPELEIKNLKRKVKELSGYKDKYQDLVNHIERQYQGAK